METHRHVYRGDESEAETEFGVLFGQEMDAAENTMQHLVGRAQEIRKERQRGEAADAGEESKLMPSTEDFEEKLYSLQVGSAGSFIQKTEHKTAEAERLAATAAAKATVEAAAAQTVRALELMERDGQGLEEAVGIFQTVFLEAHAHIRFLREQGVAPHKYMCKYEGNYMWHSHGYEGDLEIGDCVKTSDARSYDTYGSFCSCDDWNSCQAKIREHFHASCSDNWDSWNCEHNMAFELSGHVKNGYVSAWYEPEIREWDIWSATGQHKEVR